MKLSETIQKFERFLAECDPNELQIIWDLVKMATGREFIRVKIAQMMIYKESMTTDAEKLAEAYMHIENAKKLRDEAEVFNKIMKDSGYEKP